MHNVKALKNQMSSFVITCNYNKMLRFKKSASTLATSDDFLPGLSDCSEGLFQMIVNNFMLTFLHRISSNAYYSTFIER